jgi:hypothetical protein
MMRTGEVVANLSVLNETFRIQEIDDLVQRKREGAEKMLLRPDELDAQLTILGRLDAALEQAHADSSLPEEATTADALSDFVVRARLEWAR